jgi:hypothetical protein
MRMMLARSLIWGSCFIAALMAPARLSLAANCALYARAETGVALYGAAGGWWDEAAGLYERGHVPAVGAILVFKRTRHIPSGHVAVVAGVVSAHEILVDQANWYRGTVTRSMSVIDTSADHDWTTVAVIDLPSGKYGRDNPTYGFVYPRSGPIPMLPMAGMLRISASAPASCTSPSPRRIRRAASARRPRCEIITIEKRRRTASTRALTRTIMPCSTAEPASPAHASHKAASPGRVSSARTAVAHPPRHAEKTTEVRHHRA